MKYHVFIDYDDCLCSYEIEGTLEYVIEDVICRLDELSEEGSFSIYELPQGVDGDAVYSADWAAEPNGDYWFFT